MDVETLAVALKLAPKKTLPAVTPSDAGLTMVVGNDGKWTKGEVVSATISVDNHTMVVVTE